MELQPEINEELILRNINKYKAYLRGDIEGFSQYWADNIIIQGTAKGESFRNKVSAKEFYSKTLDQVVDVLKIEHKHSDVVDFGHYCILTDDVEFYMKEGDKWIIVYDNPARLTTVWSQIEGEWLETLVHCSFPDINTTEGEQFNYQNVKDENAKLKLAVDQRTAELNQSLKNLMATQVQLIHSEKMASLGELTAGIAHEIQNPLNFVNNFSEVSTELVDEMKSEIKKGNYDEVNVIADDVKQNLEKINHHGTRAADIVKGMLQHSRSSSGVKEPTDINALADEYLRLAYHGLKAKDIDFNATMKTDLDESIDKIKIIPQDIGRVILNLITNAFYAVNEKSKQGIAEYEPTVSVVTKKVNHQVEIRVTDNGNGIPPNILDKIFQPFFTTKPTGQGTGLGLSLSYDIVKAHGGELKVETLTAEAAAQAGKEGAGTTFIISLPL
jgi:signal transduction histidine kinase